MSAGDIDDLLQIWGSSLALHNDNAPFSNHRAMYRMIDAIPYGEVPWKSFTVSYTGNRPSEAPYPSWMDEPQVIWYRDPLLVLRSMVANPDFSREFDYTPYHEYVAGVHQFHDFMSGDWAWKEAVCIVSRLNPFANLTLVFMVQDLISRDPKTHGAFFVPIILGSDKTTVSVATGNNEYWPVYLSIGNIRNTTRRAHRNGITVVAFLATPKGE